MVLKPNYEEKDGFTLVPKDDYERMYRSLFNIAVTGIRDKNDASEVHEAFEWCVDAARWGLGWDRSEG